MLAIGAPAMVRRHNGWKKMSKVDCTTHVYFGFCDYADGVEAGA